MSEVSDLKAKVRQLEAEKADYRKQIEVLLGNLPGQTQRPSTGFPVDVARRGEWRPT